MDLKQDCEGGGSCSFLLGAPFPFYSEAKVPNREGKWGY